MTSRTVFDELSLDRKVVRWEEHLRVLTPVDEGPSGVLWKREDAFAPLGYGGVNGAKLRQLIHLIDGYRRSGGTGGLLTGASVLSPQVSMSALVAAHYDLPCLVVLGGTRPDTASRHENVAIASAAGAWFRFIRVGYNPALQAEVKRLAETEHPDWFRLCYGITTGDGLGDGAVEAFHAVGANQTRNVPASVRTLVMTAGSCNSCVSVLYGLARNPNNVTRVVLLGIGPTRLAWIDDRLAAIERATGMDLRGRFRRRYHQHPDLAREQDAAAGGPGPVTLEHYDLHVTKFASYQDRMPYRIDGIDLHPTYEGKALTYLERRSSEFGWFWRASGDVLFWIVGSVPQRAPMARFLGAP